jgi:hypothetical protein
MFLISIISKPPIYVLLQSFPQLFKIHDAASASFNFFTICQRQAEMDLSAVSGLKAFWINS